MPVQSTRGPLETDDIPCWDCNGDGLVVSPEAVDHAAHASADFYMDFESNGGYDHWLEPAESALRAALGIEKT